MTPTEPTRYTIRCTQNVFAVLLSLGFKFMNIFEIIVSRRKLKACLSACPHITEHTE